MNFLLYCCFSDRFRSTFRSSFAFLSKYCAHYIHPNWKITTDENNHSISLDNTSFNFPNNQSNYSLHGPSVNTRISNDIGKKHLKKTSSNTSRRANEKRQSWTLILAKLKSNKNEKENYKQTLIRQSTETVGIIQLKRFLQCRFKCPSN
jgi:hypothetical protein